MSTSAHLPAGLRDEGSLAARRTIPFDYSFRFVLDGEPGKSHTKTVTISIEAAFIAVSIGYGVIATIEEMEFGPEELGDLEASAAPAPVALAAVGPASRRSVISLPSGTLTQITGGRTTLVNSLVGAISAAIAQSTQGTATLLSDLTPPSRDALVGSPRQLSVGDLIRALARKLQEGNFTALGEIGPKTQFALLHGIRLNPEVAKAFLVNAGNASLDANQLARLFETIGAQPERVQFLYALRDEATGREFQSDFVLNIAGLGISDGDRPFRHFAMPITFAPRANIRLDIIEKSKFTGELFVSLHGYKVLGGTGTPTGRALRSRRRGR